MKDPKYICFEVHSVNVQHLLGSNMTKADFELLLTTDMFNISSDKIDDVLAVYADASNTSSTDWYWTATKVYGDYAIACPSLRAAHQIAKMSSKEPQGFALHRALCNASVH